MLRLAGLERAVRLVEGRHGPFHVLGHQAQPAEARVRQGASQQNGRVVVLGVLGLERHVGTTEVALDLGRGRGFPFSSRTRRITLVMALSIHFGDSFPSAPCSCKAEPSRKRRTHSSRSTSYWVVKSPQNSRRPFRPWLGGGSYAARSRPSFDRTRPRCSNKDVRRFRIVFLKIQKKSCFVLRERSRTFKNIIYTSSLMSHHFISSSYFAVANVQCLHRR